MGCSARRTGSPRPAVTVHFRIQNLIVGIAGTLAVIGFKCDTA